MHRLISFNRSAGGAWNTLCRWSLLALVGVCVSNGALAASLTWRVNAAPFSLIFLNDAGVVTSEIDPATVGAGGRLAYKSGGTIADNVGTSFHLTNLVSQTAITGGVRYTVATDEANRVANVAVTQTSRGVRVALSFSGAGTGAVTTIWEALNAASTEHYLSGSSAAHLDLRGWIRAWRPGKEGNHVEEYCKNQAEVATPYYFSSGGYGFYADTANVGRFSFPGADPNAPDGPNCRNTPSVPSGATTPQPCAFNTAIKSDRVQVCLRGSQLTYHVYEGSPQDVTSDYYATVGLPLLPPPAQYGLWKWRDVNSNQAQVVSDVASFVSNNIPITGVWIDNPWEVQPTSNTTRQNGSACTNSGAFDPRFFPDPKAMIDAIHAQGVLFGLWVGSNVVGPGGSSTTGGGTCTTNPQWNANRWFIPGTNYIDFTNPSAFQAWVNLYTPLFSLGVDMAKEDRAEEYQLETATLAAGSGATFYTQFPAFYHLAVTQALRNARVARGLDPEGFVTFVRTAFTGDAQVTHGLWASDMYHDFTALQAAVRLGVSQSLTGAPASWASDTGGIDPRSPATNTNSPTKTAFVRWAQFSALSSGLEVGGAGLNQDPVGNYDAATLALFRDSVVLHYALFPYMYGLAQQAASQGVPVMRGVGFEYPADQGAWAQDQAFMVGSNLLVAPVTASTAEAEGAAGLPSNVPVYLPVGNWIDLYSGAKIVGPSSLVRSAPVSEFPLYMRAGSAIGFNLRAPNAFAGAWGTNNLTEANRAGWMYAPQQGQTQAPGFYGTSGQAPTQALLAASTDGNRVRLTLSNAPVEAEVLVLAQTPPTSVVVDDVGVPQAASIAALQAMPSGWIFTNAPFGGALIKLAPAGGDSRIALTLAAPTASSSTSLATAPNPSAYGQASSFTATVGDANASGSVQYQVDWSSAGVPVSLVNGQAQLSVPALSAGIHSIVAVYSGDLTHLGSTSAPVSQIVNVAATSTMLASDATVTVAPLAPAGGIPTGTVQFGNAGANAGAPVTLVGGKAILAAGTLAPGPYTLSASYGGDGNFAASSTTAIVTVTYVSSGVFGDVNGDGVLSCEDLGIAGLVIGKRTGQPGFQPTADIDGNGVIDVRDISAISRLLPSGTRC